MAEAAADRMGVAEDILREARTAEDIREVREGLLAGDRRVDRGFCEGRLAVRELNRRGVVRVDSGLLGIIPGRILRIRAGCSQGTW